VPAQEIQANLDAEQALLGSMLLDAGVADSVIARITEDAFYSEPHRMVFKAIQAVRVQGGAVDIVTIMEALRQAGTLELVGGATYISVLGNSVPNVEHWEDHLKIVQEKATFRALKAEALRLQELADAGDIHKALEAIERAQAEAAAMIEGGRDRARVVNLAGVEAQETRWLWRPYIPLDCITILEGDPKTGKTWAALAITAAITRGYPLPGEDGKPVARMPGNVLYLTAEDSLSMTLRPRLEKGNADLSRVNVLEGKISADGKTVVPVTMQDLDILAQTLERYRPVLVVIDPMAAFLGTNVNANRFEQVRPVLAGVTRLAEVYGCAVLLIRHLSKGPKDRAIYKGQGSIDFTAAARSVLMVGKDPNIPGQRVMVHNLCNVAKEGPAQAFCITDEGKLEWAGVSEVTGDELVAPVMVDVEERGSRAEAKEFLLKALANGRQLATDMEEARKAHDIADRTLKRARQDLNIQVYRDGKAWYWELPTVVKPNR
jgi:hypothetical protein